MFTSFRAKLTVELVQDILPATVVIPDHLPLLDVDYVGDILPEFPKKYNGEMEVTF